jgi:hypothetical protein
MVQVGFTGLLTGNRTWDFPNKKVGVVTTHPYRAFVEKITEEKS